MSQNFSTRGVRKAMEDASPGSYQGDAIKFMQEHLEEYVKKIIPFARQISYSAGRKRVSKNDIKLAISRP